MIIVLGFVSDWTSDSHLTHYLPCKMMVFQCRPKLQSVYMLIPKLEQTLFGNGESPYGNFFVSLPISIQGIPIWLWGG